MTMPKGWIIPSGATTKLVDQPDLIDGMPSPNSLSLRRPMLPTYYLRHLSFPLKKIEVFDTETGDGIETRDIEFMEIHQIEGDYCVILKEDQSDKGLSLPMQKLTKISTIADDKLEISFVGTEITGSDNLANNIRENTVRIKIDKSYTNEIFEFVKTAKALEEDNSYWSKEWLTVYTSDNQDKRIEVFYLAPFLADGEQIIWQNMKFQMINNKKNVKTLDALTNYRLFQYEYDEHQGKGFLFSSLDDVKVTRQEHGTLPQPQEEFIQSLQKN